MGGLLFGYDLSIISGAIIYLKKAFHLSDVQEGFAMASAVIGCVLGPLVASLLADRIGRKPTLIIAAMLFGASSVGAALPATIGQFNFFRAIGGIGVGLSSTVSPMYIAEISPARIRGRLVTVNQLGIVGGSFIAILVSYAIARSGMGNEWRWMFASECVPVALLFVGLLFVPESPRWLAQRGHDHAANAVLTRIEGADYAAAEMRTIATDSTEEQGRFFELFRPGMRIALLVAIGLAVFQQITGASILFANAPIVFQKAGFSAASDAIGQTVLLQLWNVAMTVLSMWLVDRVGRRLLLLWGVGAMELGMIAMGLVFASRASGIYVLLVMFFAIGAVHHQPGSARVADHVGDLPHAAAKQRNGRGRRFAVVGIFCRPADVPRSARVFHQPLWLNFGYALPVRGRVWRGGDLLFTIRPRDPRQSARGCIATF